MPNPIPPDVAQLIADQIATGRYASADDVLRDALYTLQHVNEEAVAIQAAIDNWKNGDAGIPLDHAIDQIRINSPQKP